MCDALYVRILSGNRRGEFGSVTGWFIGDGGLKAALVNVDALVVGQVFTAASLVLEAKSPLANGTRFSVEYVVPGVVLHVTCCGTWVGYVLLAPMNQSTLVTSLLSGSVGSKVGGGDLWVSLVEASEDVCTVAETFNHPL